MAAGARPDGVRQVVPDQVGVAGPGHAVEQDVHVVEALVTGGRQRRRAPDSLTRM